MLWIKALGGSWAKRKNVITAALESGFSVVLANEEDWEKIRKLADVKVAGFKKGADILLSDLKSTYDKKKLESAYIEIGTKGDEDAAAQAGKKASYLVVDNKNWKVIPLENLIAKLQGTKCKLIAKVRSEKEAKLVFETMEVGVDGIVLETGDPSTVKKTGEYVKKMLSEERLNLKVLTVTKVEQVGMGDRVCVDTCSMMVVGEGMLVGSGSNGFFLVHSESMDSEYVAARPFRVNAGPVHAYIKAPKDKTNYLSELKAGMEVLVVNIKGEGKPAIVGRVKIEKRPLILVEAEAEGVKVQTILQNAETINLVSKNKKPVSVTKIKPGAEVLGYVEEAGRHFGMKVKESIVEK
ncbi:MAG: 3-dehydroquinate synthase II [Candidatus Altiarchaeota archaeon]